MDMGWASYIPVAVTTISGILGATDQSIKTIKSARELIKSDKNITSPELRDKLIELEEQILSMREQNLALKTQLLEIQEQRAKAEAFIAEEEKYILTETAPNSLAYALKQPRTEAEKATYFCASCFDNKIKSRLHFAAHDQPGKRLKCSLCGGLAFIAYPPTEYVAVSRRRGGVLEGW